MGRRQRRTRGVNSRGRKENAASPAADTRKVADTVADMTEKFAAQVDRTTETVQSVTTTTAQQLTSPPVLAAIALFVGLQASTSLRRLASWPVLTAIGLLAWLPFGLRAWQSFAQRRMASTETTGAQSPSSSDRRAK